MTYAKPSFYDPPTDPEAVINYDRLMDWYQIADVKFSGEFLRKMQVGTFIVRVARDSTIFHSTTEVSVVKESSNRFKRAWQAFFRK